MILTSMLWSFCQSLLIMQVFESKKIAKSELLVKKEEIDKFSLQSNWRFFFVSTWNHIYVLDIEHFDVWQSKFDFNQRSGNFPGGERENKNVAVLNYSFKSFSIACSSISIARNQKVNKK